MSEYENNFKVVIIGDGSVGKTSLLNRHLHDIFSPTVPTIGVDVKATTIADKELYAKAGVRDSTGITSIETGSNNTFTYWDLGGQSKYDQLRPSYFQGTHGIMLCFDLNDPKTLIGPIDLETKKDNVDHSIGRFLLQLVKFFGPDELKKIPFLVVGTKNDLEIKIPFETIDTITDMLQDVGLNLVSYLEDEYDGLQVYGHFSIGTDIYDRDNAIKWVSTSAKTGNNVELAFSILEIAILAQQNMEKLSIRFQHEDREKRKKIIEELRKYEL